MVSDILIKEVKSRMKRWTCSMYGGDICIQNLLCCNLKGSERIPGHKQVIMLKSILIRAFR
jgi:hypothetical protein